MKVKDVIKSAAEGAPDMPIARQMRVPDWSTPDESGRSSGRHCYGPRYRLPCTGGRQRSGTDDREGCDDQQGCLLRVRDDIAHAIKTMETKRVRRLPAADSDENSIGVVSLGDISHKVGKELSGEVLRTVSAHHRRRLGGLKDALASGQTQAAIVRSS